MEAVAGQVCQAEEQVGQEVAQAVVELRASAGYNLLAAASHSHHVEIASRSQRCASTQSWISSGKGSQQRSWPLLVRQWQLKPMER